MRYLKRVAAVQLVAVLCLALVACASDWDRWMNNLRKDPIATARWPGLEPLGREETTGEGYKPRPPKINRCYRRTIPLEEAFTQVMTTAEQEGWQEDQNLRYSESRVAQKQPEDNKATLILTSGTTGCESYHHAGFRITMIYE